MRIASILSIINQGKKKHKIIVDIFSYNIHEGKGAQKVEQYGLYPKLWMKFCKSLQHNKEKIMTPLLWRPPCSLVNNLIFPIFCELSEISLIVQSLLVFEWSERRATLWTTTRRGRIIKFVVNKESKASRGMGVWVSCLFSIAISNSCCAALYSFFSTTLPNQENLITSFDTVLLLALTSTVDILVRRVLQ